MSAELIEKTREHVAALEAELEKWRAVLTLLGDAPAAKKTKPGKKAAAGPRPTLAGKTGQPPLGKRAQKRATALEGARRLLAQDPDLSVTALQKKLSIGYNLAKELREQLAGA